MRQHCFSFTDALFADEELRARLTEAFWMNVDVPANPDEECWLWTGGLSKLGYGVFFPHKIRLAFPTLKLSYRANRLAAMLALGKPLPVGLIVRHSCDNPPCCSFKHLILGTDQQNSDDMKERKRALYGERNHATHLTTDDVRSIRATYAVGGVSMPQLARQFGVTYNAVFMMIHNHTWKGV